MAGSRRVTACRLCGELLSLVLDLGDLPLANRFRREVDPLTPTAPCRVMQCPGCLHLQLGDIVEPDLLFRTYPFRSGASSGWRDHIAAFAQTTNGHGLAIDIGSNDGTALAALAGRGYQVLGIDPSTENNAVHGYPTLTDFWPGDLAERVRAKHGAADLVTAFNVLGHVNDPVAFLRAARRVLATDGVLVVETPWVVPILQRGTFDTFYHEHVNTWGIGTLLRAGREAGLTVREAQIVKVHGGSLRVAFTVGGDTPDLSDVVDREVSALRPLALGAFVEQVTMAREATAEWCEDQRKANNLVVGYGASARGMVLLNTIPALSAVLTSIVDDTPEKQGLLTPGVPVPIERPGPWLRGVDSMIALSYPWAAQMLTAARGWGFRGPMYVPFHGEMT